MNRRRLSYRAVLALGMLTTIAALVHGFWIPVKAEIAQILLERAWDAARRGIEDAKPWPWADTRAVARLAIPALDASWVVLSGASGRNLAFAPAHMDGSAPPGDPGVTVIAGHRDTHFEALENLPLGTEILLEDAGSEIHRFSVSGVQIVDGTKSGLRLDTDRDVLVLVTCYPFDALTAGGPLRYVIQAEAVAGTQRAYARNVSAP